MKKMLFAVILALLLPAAYAGAQTAPQDAVMYQSGRLFSYGVPLDKSNVISLLGEEDGALFNKLGTRYKTGDILSYAGGCIIGSGLGSLLGTWIAGGLTPERRNMFLIFSAAGLPFLAAGLPLMKTSDKKMREIYDAYFPPRDVQLTFGGTRDGVGLTLTF